jgi:hypothetical protein
VLLLGIDANEVGQGGSFKLHEAEKYVLAKSIE